VHTQRGRLRILDKVKNIPQETTSALAVRLNIPRTTIVALISKEHQIRNTGAQRGSTAPKRSCSQDGRFKKLQTLLLERFRDQRSTDISISRPIIQQKASQFARQLEISLHDFKALSG
jgi:hypothetical protein